MHVRWAVGQLDSALRLSASAFAATYGFPKPTADTEVKTRPYLQIQIITHTHSFSLSLLISRQVVFHCQSGRRSEAATALALSTGLRRARNYRGSFAEWSAHHPPA